MSVKNRLKKLEKTIKPSKKVFTSDDWTFEELLEIIEYNPPEHLKKKAENTDWNSGSIIRKLEDYL
ncbi:MAG: hypothetical protein H0Z28_11665 [Archaeoglobus sp.]|nr:hypothetical protein [Archaeoglobus sp.]